MAREKEEGIGFESYNISKTGVVAFYGTLNLSDAMIAVGKEIKE